METGLTKIIFWVILGYVIWQRLRNVVARESAGARSRVLRRRDVRTAGELPPRAGRPTAPRLDGLGEEPDPLGDLLDGGEGTLEELVKRPEPAELPRDLAGSSSTSRSRPGDFSRVQDDLDEGVSLMHPEHDAHMARYRRHSKGSEISEIPDMKRRRRPLQGLLKQRSLAAAVILSEVLGPPKARNQLRGWQVGRPFEKR